MKKTDLRLNNLIYGNYDTDNDELQEVVKVVCLDSVGITENGYDIIVDGNNEYYYEFNGIPITEKWLKKANFFNITSTDFQKNIKHNDIIMNANTKMGYEFWYNGTLIKDINYVHELQNLYYSLTDNQELVFSEA